jgi:RNA recognition motif-containing protein
MPFEVEKTDLMDLFADFKPTEAFIASSGGFKKRSKGFGFLKFESEKIRNAALDEFEGAQLEGRALVVRKVEEREKTIQTVN